MNKRIHTSSSASLLNPSSLPSKTATCLTHTLTKQFRFLPKYSHSRQLPLLRSSSNMHPINADIDYTTAISYHNDEQTVSLQPYDLKDLAMSDKYCCVGRDWCGMRWRCLLTARGHKPIAVPPRDLRSFWSVHPTFFTYIPNISDNSHPRHQTQPQSLS